MPRGVSAKAVARPDVVGGTGVAGFVAVAVALSALAIYGVWAFWPPEELPGREPPAEKTVHLLGFEPTLSRERLFLVVLACAGALGALPRVLRSLEVSSGNRVLRWRAAVDYLVPVALGVGLGSVLAVVAELGLPSNHTESAYWPAALAALAGFLAHPAGRTIRRLLGLKPRRF
jgi:hypothetical protein